MRWTMINGDDTTRNAGGKQPERKLGFVSSVSSLVALRLWCC
jgi:hypothetical protein